MNFNLISPVGNGHNFNVRFNEPIIIPEDASVSLNWGQFERDNKIRFTEAQTIKVNPVVLPYYNVMLPKVGGEFIRNGLEANVGDFTYTIPAGTYNLKDLQNAITDAFTATGKCMVSELAEEDQNQNSTRTADNKSLMLANYMFVNRKPHIDDSHLVMGFSMSPKNTVADIHPTHRKDFSVLGSGLCLAEATGSAFLAGSDANANKQKGLPAEGSYASYALLKHKYNHCNANFESYTHSNGEFRSLNDGHMDEIDYQNTVHITMNQLLTEQVGNVFVGLYSEGYAGINDGVEDVYTGSLADDDTGDPVAQRIQKNNMKTVKSQTSVNSGFYPKCVFGLEITGTNANVGEGVGKKAGKAGMINVVMAEFGTIAPFDAITQEFPIKGMRVVKTVDPRASGLVGLDVEALQIGFQTYFDRGNKHHAFHGSTKGTCHLRAYVMDSDGSKEVFFDTNTSNPTTQPDFVKGLVSAGYMSSYQTGNPNLAKAISTIPFTPIIAATENGEGADIEYSAIKSEFNGTGADSNARIDSILLDYTMTLSPELGSLYTPTSLPLTLTSKGASYLSYLGIVEYYMNKGIYYNMDMDDNDFWYDNRSVIGQYRQDKYSIVLNNLPIKAYKNTDDKSKSGYRKPILANVPSPFSGADVAMGHNGTIMGSYVPSLGVVNRLSNQTMTTNNFDVEIRDMENDKPAEQLTKTIINFTITGNQ